jgi:hypothetical protein
MTSEAKTKSGGRTRPLSNLKLVPYRNLGEEGVVANPVRLGASPVRCYS